ncbi:hypothetical protein B6N60_03577 [Richelia sinica FACHB-800]|uniref:Uncharacterized protein n=1 Tax=Richelia sinica FACHB-800 TaxID=1357546 RepID=A0A975Y639_9NOST|nr:hypothetical protein [Richelia sinica]QXE24867.1 hypothetical protein B6N60_03577 [Richelia sinica FACHB-800]
MPKKRLADLLQEEAQKFTPNSDEPTIEVTAQAIVVDTITEPETDTTSVSEAPAVKRANSQKAELEATIKELQKTINTAQKQEIHFQEQINDLQAALSERDGLVEKLARELSEAKQTALQLADANSQLLEEIKALKEPKGHSKLIYKQPTKTHRNLPHITAPNNEPKEDFGSNTWLYD